MSLAEQDSQLEKLNPVMKAHYKPDTERMCLAGTRKELLGDSKHWICGSPHLEAPQSTLYEGMKNKKIIWLNGQAGSGKSAIANTVARMVADEQIALSCFFCKLDDPDLSSPNRFFPTLSFRIAQQNAEYREAVLALLRSPTRADVLTGDVNTQFKLLFRDLAESLNKSQQAHIIVIDALDECGDSPSSRRKLATSILALTNVMTHLRIFLTSRTEQELIEIFTADNKCYPVDINTLQQTDSDIRLYSATRLEELKMSLSEKELDLLVAKAGGLFIWCSTFFKYLEDDRNRKRVIKRILAGDDGRDSFGPLYSLYDKILESAAKHDHDRRVMRAILGVVYVTSGTQPLSAKGIASFLQKHESFRDEDEESVQNTVAALHAVLHEDRAMRGAIRAYHLSFLDFLKFEMEQTTGWTKPVDVHRLMAHGCLDTLLQELKLNICGLKNAFRLNKDIPDLRDRINKHVSQGLCYSSLFWMVHYARSSDGSWQYDGVYEKISRLICSEKAFYWLEVMSLVDAIDRSITILRECHNLLAHSAVGRHKPCAMRLLIPF